MMHSLKFALAAGALMTASAPAAAASLFFGLTADPANAVYNGNTFTLDIPYLNGPFLIEQGDDITVSLSLDDLLNTPALASGTGVLFLDILTNQNIEDPDGPGSDALVTTDASLQLLDGTYAGEIQYSGCVNCIFSAFGKPANGTPFGFSQLNSFFFIQNLVPSDPNQPVEGTGFRLTFQVFDDAPPAVPEPATWAMMILGFGMIGGAARQRRSIKLTA